MNYERGDLPYLHIIFTNQFFIQEEIFPHCSLQEADFTFNMVVQDVLETMQEFTQQLLNSSVSGEGLIDSNYVLKEIQKVHGSYSEGKTKIYVCDNGNAKDKVLFITQTEIKEDKNLCASLRSNTQK